MDVGDDRDGREADDLRERLRVLRLRDRDADDLAARARERCDLRGRRLDVVRLRRRHRLHDDGRAAADLDAADARSAACWPSASQSSQAGSSGIAPSEDAEAPQCGTPETSFEDAITRRSRMKREPDDGDPLVDLARQGAAADGLDQREEDVAAVEGQQRQEVQERERHAHEREDLEVVRPADLAAVPARPGRSRQAPRAGRAPGSRTAREIPWRGAGHDAPRAPILPCSLLCRSSTGRSAPPAGSRRSSGRLP